jgi:hypothetical protein
LEQGISLILFPILQDANIGSLRLFSQAGLLERLLNTYVTSTETKKRNAVRQIQFYFLAKGLANLAQTSFTRLQQENAVISPLDIDSCITLARLANWCLDFLSIQEEKQAKERNPAALEAKYRYITEKKKYKKGLEIMEAYRQEAVVQ